MTASATQTEETITTKRKQLQVYNSKARTCVDSYYYNYRCTDLTMASTNMYVRAGCHTKGRPPDSILGHSLVQNLSGGSPPLEMCASCQFRCPKKFPSQTKNPFVKPCTRVHA